VSDGEHRRIAGRYAIAAVSGCISAAVFGGFGWLLLYPAASCLGVAYVYVAARPELLHPDRWARPHWIVLLAPYYLGAWCSWRWFATRVTPWNAISADMLIARRLLPAEANRLSKSGVSAVLNLAPELPSIRGFYDCKYRHIPMLDLVPPSVAQLTAALAFVAAQPPGSTVLIHCALGYSRSAAVATACLIRQGLSIDQALQWISHERPGIVLTDGALQVLQHFAPNPRTFAANSGSMHARLRLH
jgi:protein-tyrosine phosphatase